MLNRIRRRWVGRAIPMAAALLLLVAGWAGGEVQHLRHHLEGCPGDSPRGSSHDPWDAHGACVSCQAFHHGWAELAPVLDLAAADEASERTPGAQQAPPDDSRLDLPSARGPPGSLPL